MTRIHAGSLELSADVEQLAARVAKHARIELRLARERISEAVEILSQVA
jgi:hypothetical protein